ncbi:hypothetical protein OL229_20680 [Neisseriaceae bacterium JH1-16]|nr:hypothetical protein [Neisseriaceae bacterium JH1-16]
MDQQQYNRMLSRLYRLPIVLGVAALVLLCIVMAISGILRDLPAPDTLFLLLFLAVALLSFSALGTALSMSVVLAAWAMGRLLDCANCQGLLVRQRRHDSLGRHRRCLACNARFCSLSDKPAELPIAPEATPAGNALI